MSEPLGLRAGAPSSPTAGSRPDHEVGAIHVALGLAGGAADQHPRGEVDQVSNAAASPIRGEHGSDWSQGGRACNSALGIIASIATVANCGAAAHWSRSSRRSSTCWSIWCRTAIAWSARTTCWKRCVGGRIVSESALSSRITAVRKAIGDDGKGQRLIRTLPRKGLRFIGSVDDVEQQAPPRDTPAMLSERPGGRG